MFRRPPPGARRKPNVKKTNKQRKKTCDSCSPEEDPSEENALSERLIYRTIRTAMAIEEIIRQLTCSGCSFDYYFHRTAAGAEVDLVLEGDFGLIPVEIKHTQTVDPRKLRSLKDFVQERRCRMGLVINNDLTPRLYDENIVGLPFAYV